MIIGKKNPILQPIKLGEMPLKTIENYKYLGEIINDKRSLKKQLQETQRKTEGALQTILHILNPIRMNVCANSVPTTK